MPIYIRKDLMYLLTIVLLLGAMSLLTVVYYQERDTRIAAQASIRVQTARHAVEMAKLKAENEARLQSRDLLTPRGDGATVRIAGHDRFHLATQMAGWSIHISVPRHDLPVSPVPEERLRARAETLMRDYYGAQGITLTLHSMMKGAIGGGNMRNAAGRAAFRDIFARWPAFFNRASAQLLAEDIAVMRRSDNKEKRTTK